MPARNWDADYNTFCHFYTVSHMDGINHAWEINVPISSYEFRQIHSKWILEPATKDKLEVHQLVVLPYWQLISVLLDTSGRMLYKGESYQAKLQDREKSGIQMPGKKTGNFLISVRKLANIRVALIKESNQPRLKK